LILVFIPVTRRVKGYTRFVGKYVTGRRATQLVIIPVTRRVKGYTRFVGKYVTGRRTIPVTRRVKGYTRFVGKYVTGRRKCFRPHKVYIFLIRITNRVDLAMSVCPSVYVRLSVRPDER